MPSIARPTKGATWSCDDADPAGRGPRRPGRGPPRRLLPPVPPSRPELPRPGTGGRSASPVRKRTRPARRVALGHFTPLSALGYLATIALFGVWHALLFWLVVRVRLRLPAVPVAIVLPVAWTAVEFDVDPTAAAAQRKLAFADAAKNGYLVALDIK